MSDTEIGLVVLTVLLGVILAPANYLFAQLTLSYGLQHNRLRLAHWAGLAFGPLGPLIMRRLPEGDPVQFRRELISAYSKQREANFPWTNGIVTTVLGAGIGYYILASVLILHRLPYLPLWAIGSWLSMLGIGWLCHRGAFPHVIELPAPTAVPSEISGHGPRIVFHQVLLRRVQAARLAQKGVWVLGVLLVIDLCFLPLAGMPDRVTIFDTSFPLKVVFAILIAVFIYAGAIWAQYLKRQINEPGNLEELPRCPVCRQQIVFGEKWVLQPGACVAHHPRCLELGMLDLENLPSAELASMTKNDLALVTESGQACRVCGQFIDPVTDAYLDCPECFRIYHRSCFGQDVVCTYCFSGEAVPAVAEKIARENEAQHRVPHGSYDDGVNQCSDIDEDLERLVCRGCGLQLDERESLVKCGQCRRMFHTACMEGGGICHTCATGELVPDEMETYCQEKEVRLFQLSTGIYDCPACDAKIRHYGLNYRYCPYCGAELNVPDRYQVLYEVHADGSAEGDAQELKGRANAIPGAAPSVEVRHGWLRQETFCSGLIPITLVGVWMAFGLGKWLPEPWPDLSQGFALGLCAASIVVGLSQWMIARVRAQLWPMPAPSPEKAKLINTRTCLFWISGVLGVLLAVFTFTSISALSLPGAITLWLFLMSLASAIFLAIASLFVK